MISSARVGAGFIPALTQQGENTPSFLIRKKATRGSPFCSFIKRSASPTTLFLLTQTESLHNLTVAVDVTLLEIGEETTTLTYELSQRASGHEVLVVSLDVLSQVSDTIREERDLCLC